MKTQMRDSANKDYLRGMDGETLDALCGSIEKWEKIVAGTGMDEGWNNCPLCAMFYIDDDCEGCPVKDKSAREGCSGTPYEEWVVYQVGNGKKFPLSVFNDESLLLAQRELDFLKSLLPESPK